MMISSQPAVMSAYLRLRGPKQKPQLPIEWDGYTLLPIVTLELED